MRKPEIKIVKKIMSLILTGVLTVSSVVSVFGTYATQEFKTSAGKICIIKMSAGTIGEYKYSLTSILDGNGNKYKSMYVDVELFCSGIENPYDDKSVTDGKKVSVSVNNSSGGKSSGKGVTNTNVGDTVYGYGGSIMYN